VPATEVLTAAQARRLAISAQGLGRSHPAGRITVRHLDRVVAAIGVLQIDSVNVLIRSHYLPVFSRLGPYPRGLLDAAAHRSPRRLVEYWAHEASYTTPATHALLGFRRHRAEQEAWAGLRRIAADRPRLLEDVLAYVAAHGPLTASRIERGLGGPGPGPRIEWGWNWSETKMSIEYLFRAGRLASARRTTQFEREYDLPERVIPAWGESGSEIDEATACRELVALAADAHGVGTEACLRDYFRLTAVQARRAVAELLEQGRLRPVRVDGWRRPAYCPVEVRIPRRMGGSALLSPFDPLVWFRERTEALFGVRYRIEIYTPPARRVYGYYVLPYLVGDRLVARVDLKADRTARRLLVQASWLEPAPLREGLDDTQIARSLAADLGRMAEWLGLDGVCVAERGDLARELSPAVAAVA
jgi:uncharacterized protein YcaQ